MKQFLKKTKRFIMHYWLSISLGMIATPFAIQYAYQDRGRLAFGGEYLVLPAMVMGAYLLRQVVPAILEMIYELIYGEEEPMKQNRKSCRSQHVVERESCFFIDKRLDVLDKS